MTDLSAADIANLRDLLDAVTPGLLPLTCDQASLSQMRMTGAPIEYVVADANGLEFATARNQDEETTDLIVRAVNALPALLDAAEKVRALKALHSPDDGGDGYRLRCCTECLTHWPCATSRAINTEEAR